MNPGIVQNVVAQFFLSNPYKVIKTSWLVVPVLILTSCSGKNIKTLTPNLELLVKQFNNAIPEKINDPTNSSLSKYYDNEEMHDIKIPHKNKSLSLFHINVCSFNKKFDYLQHFLSSSKKILT